MGSLGFQFSQLGFAQIPKPQHNYSTMGCSTLRISCGLRKGYKKPMYRSRVLSTEAIQAVQSLKLAKSPSKLDEVFSSRISRLLKADLLDTLTELQRQNELDLASKVFKFLRTEIWYEPNAELFSDMMRMMGKNKLVNNVEELFYELKKEGLEPDARAYAELIGAYLQVEKIDKAMDTYELMKNSGCNPDELTLTIMIRNLESFGEEELAATVKKDCSEYLDSPEKFLKEVESKFPKRKPVNHV